MDSTGEKTSRNVIVANELGIHARTAAKIAEMARQAESVIWITKDGATVDASGILEILTLECSMGSEIALSVENDRDIDIRDAIAAMIEKGFEE